MIGEKVLFLGVCLCGKLFVNFDSVHSADFWPNLNS